MLFNMRALRILTAARLRLLFVFMTLLAFGATGGSAQQKAAQDHNWTKHSFREDRFEIEFSGPFRTDAVKLDPATRKKVARSTQHIQVGSDFVFIVGAQHNIDAVNFDAGAQGSFATLNCLSRDSDTPLPVPGGRGREIKGNECLDNTMRVETRYVESGKWFYQLIAIVPKERTEDPAVQRFLQSFKIVGP
ncbi:MAG: hypothetical protein ACKVP7_19355 [Hyphomicrobiaceae bacterium]